jgi:hypothetical protein
MPPEHGGPAAGNGQHYESFIVRVLLNDDGSIRDTRMEHVGTGEVRRWAGWEPSAMLGFVKAMLQVLPPLTRWSHACCDAIRRVFHPSRCRC